MLSIDCENFDIIDPIVDPDDLGFGVSAFDCDDLMAPIISELNKRGYYTQWCCQGHYIEYAERYREDIDVLIEGHTGYTELIPKHDKYSYPVISFHPEVYLRMSNHISSLPSEWVAHTIMYQYTPCFEPRNEFRICLKDKDKCEFSNPYEFYARMIELHKILYDWVCTLPTYSDIRDAIDLNWNCILVPGGVNPKWKDSVVFLSDEENTIHEKGVEAQLAAQLDEYRKNHPAG